MAKYIFSHKDITCPEGYEVIDNRTNTDLDHRLFSEWAGIDLLNKRFDKNDEIRKGFDTHTDPEEIAKYTNPDWVTFAHYRRMPDPLCTNRIYISQPIVLSGSVAQQYATCHFIEDLTVMGKAIKELYPQMVPFAEQVLNGNILVPYNIVTGPYGQIRDYTNFVLSVLKKVHEMLGNQSYEERMEMISKRTVPEYDGRNNDPTYQARIEAFLSERLSTIYFLKIAQQVPVFPMTIIKDKDVF